MAKVADFKPATRNANKHSARGLGALQSSIQGDGWIGAMTTAADGEMIAGSARIETSAQVFGVDAEPIVIESDGTRPIIVRRTDIPQANDPRAVRLALADNRIQELDLTWDVEVLAGLDADVLEGLWTADELSDLGQQWADEQKAAQDDPGAQVDKAEELQAKWNVKPGDLWQLGAHRLICGDCTDAATVARVMGGEKAQLVVTSPPYPGADMWDDMGIVAEVERVGLDALRVSSQFVDVGCPILWNVANTPIGTQAGVVHTTTAATTKIASEELGLLCYGEIIWAKPCQHLTPLSFMMRPVVPNLVHEYVMIFYNGKRKQRENTSGLSDEDKGIRTKSVWESNTESADEIGHKAPFPLELARRCVALWSLEKDTILEPFLGSGTTMIACERLGRKCRAIEIAPKYCAVALERWATMTGQTPTLVPDA